MSTFLTTAIGRFRLLAFFEGVSLLVLVFVSIPLKRFYGITEVSTVLGPIHGILFILFVLYALVLAAEFDWKFFRATWKVILSSFIPFGTFYVDHKILQPLHERARAN